MRILIIGAGIAGTSAAIHLRRMGVEVCLIEQKSLSVTPVFKHGESLPPEGIKLIRGLNLETSFLADNHLPCYGNKSAWGSTQLHYQDFISHPTGHGWHIDRWQFEQSLLHRACELGAVLKEETAIHALSYQKSLWTIVTKDAEGKFSNYEYSFIIDASGPKCWLARKLGIKREVEDKQLALLIPLKLTTPFEDRMSLIETTSNGWWYSAGLPDDRLVLNFYCKPNKNQRHSWLEKNNWLQLLDNAPHTKNRLESTNYELIEQPKFVSAGTSILDQVYGDGWLAIGDAAMSYDPVASHGMTMAMVSARDATKLIRDYYSGRQDALVAYDKTLRAAFDYYCLQRQKIYASEQRFDDCDYWSKRD